ncbi:MAG: aspartate kinase [Anaerolineae bacterium]|nr:aspartate kinase [Anaerolineae bacterium]
MKTLVMKFGGTSVGSIDAIKNVIQIVRQARRDGVEQIAVVVSAMSGVTDKLKTGVLGAEAGATDTIQQVGQTLREKHETVLRTLGGDDIELALAEINSMIDDYVRFCDSVSVLGEATPRALDYTMGLGERISARQIAAVLRAADVPAQAVDATHMIVTDDRFQNAAPLMDQTRRRVREIIPPIFKAGEVAVITGFVGATEQGINTTLGRGASDYTAAIVAACLEECDELWIWTDVDGVMSADPRVAPEASTIDVLSYREVSELAYYGAKVLHPKTISPVLEAGISIRVKNTFNPEHPGTLIVPNGDARTGQLFKAVTAVRDVGLVTVEGKGMLGVPGIAARTFGAVARTGTNVLLISQASSEQSICFMVPMGSVQTVVDTLTAEFDREIDRRDIDRIAALAPLTIITVVGAGILYMRGIAAKIFAAVADAGVNVIAIAQGSSECGISFAVSAEEGDAAVRAIHALTK